MSAEAIFRTAIEEIWNQRIEGAVEKHVSPSYVGHNPDGDRAGLAGYREVVTTYNTAFPDCRVELGDGVGDGDTAAVHYVFKGTHTGDLMGIAPTGKTVAVHGIGIARVEDGQIVEDRVVWDTLSLMQQIGAA